MPRSAPSGAGAAGPLPHPVHVSQRRDVGASCGALRLWGAAVRCGQPMENSRKVVRRGAPMIVPKVRYGNPVRPNNFTSVPDPSAQPPRLGCHRLRGRPRRPGRRAGGRDEKPVSAGLRAVGAVVPGLPAAAPAPVRLPHRRSRRRPPIRPPLAPVLPRPQFFKAPAEPFHGPGAGVKWAGRPSRTRSLGKSAGFRRLGTVSSLASASSSFGAQRHAPRLSRSSQARCPTSLRIGSDGATAGLRKLRLEPLGLTPAA